jgi:hypothetical protein
MLRDRTTRLLLALLAAFAAGVAALALSGYLANSGSTASWCRQSGFTPAGVRAMLRADAFTVRVPGPPAGYEIGGPVGPIRMTGGARPDGALFRYYSRDCRRSLSVQEYGSRDAAAAGLASLGSPARAIRVHQVSWLVWRHFQTVEGTYADGVHVMVLANRAGASTVLALLRNFPPE